MKLYVCWNTNPGPGKGFHPCGRAHRAVVDAGHAPQVLKAKGNRLLPDALFNRSAERREVKRLTGKVDVPVLVLDDGTVVDGARAIVAWASANPAS